MSELSSNILYKFYWCSTPRCLCQVRLVSLTHNTDDTSRVGTTDTCPKHQGSSPFCKVLVAHSPVFCVMFCRSLLIIFYLSRVAQWVGYLDYSTTHTSLSLRRHRFAPGFVNYKTVCIRLAAARDKASQLLAYDRRFSPGTPASSTTKTGRYDIAEILLQLVLDTKNQNHLRFTSSDYPFRIFKP